MSGKTVRYGQLEADVMVRAEARTPLEKYCGFVKQQSRNDKPFYEELLQAVALSRFLNLSQNDLIEFGGEKDSFDVRNNEQTYEIVQALPCKEHEVRRSLGNGQSPEIYVKHSLDHLQFPRVIIDAIEKKHKKCYSDDRHLVIVFDGDYSGESDEVVESWVRRIRQQVHLGKFSSILLVERARLKVFPVL